MNEASFGFQKGKRENPGVRVQQGAPGLFRRI